MGWQEVLAVQHLGTLEEGEGCHAETELGECVIEAGEGALYRAQGR